jgi:hypothetical protein
MRSSVSRNPQHGQAPTTTHQLANGIVFDLQRSSTNRATELNRHYLILFEMHNSSNYPILLLNCRHLCDSGANELYKGENEMHNRSLGVVFIFAAMTLAGWVSAREEPPKKQTDEEIGKLLVGKWIIDEGDGQKEPKIKGSIVYKKDNTVNLEATLDFGKETLKIILEGTWKVKDGVIIATVTKTSHPEHIKEGHVSRDILISVTEKELKYKDEMGKEKLHKRTKD